MGSQKTFGVLVAAGSSAEPTMSKKELSAHELPFLPGNTFSDPSKERFHVSNTLNFKNGYRTEAQPMHPIGGGTIPQSVISPEDIERIQQEVSSLTVKNTAPAPLTPFVPAHLAYDKKVLKFTGYFQETLPTGIEENCPNYRYRFIEISGTPQGKLLQRQRLPKDDLGNSYHWTDLNC